MQSPKLTLEDIVLLRLWRGNAREQGMTRSDLCKSVPSLCKVGKQAVLAAIDRLLADGRAVAPRKGRVEATADGIAQLRDRVVLDDGWRKLQWKHLWSRALTATALGRKAAHAKKLASNDGLWAMLLMEAAGLAWEPGVTKNQAMAKIVAHYLGTAPGSIDDFKAELLQRAMQGRPVLPSQLPARRPDDRPSVPAPELDPRAFARAAIAAARTCPAGRVGDVEVFIASVWEHGRTLDPPPWTMDLAAFKSRLTDAFKQGLVRLTRCDLAPAFDPDLVARSEVRRFGQPFHFLLTLDP